jgi:hypothetical protein
VAVTNTRSSAIWGGQHVWQPICGISNRPISQTGYHCGYISPIPYIEFNEILTEEDFRLFIEASATTSSTGYIRSVMNNGGVTYADTKDLVSDEAEEVQEVNHTKFISGANLCINLTKPDRSARFIILPAHGARILF